MGLDQAKTLPHQTYDCQLQQIHLPVSKQTSIQHEHSKPALAVVKASADDSITVLKEVQSLDKIAAGKAAAVSATWQHTGTPTSSLDASVAKENKKKDKKCGAIREKEKCTPMNCLWCGNKYSPWAGSDGVCVSEDQAKYLPDYSYKCERIKPQKGQRGSVVAAA